MSDEYLSHAITPKGQTFRPKYYKKIKTSKGDRYFYSEKEYRAYLDNQQPRRKTPVSITSDDPNLEYTNGFLAEQIADIKRRRQANKDKQRREELEKDKDARRKAAGESLKRREQEIQDSQKRAQESYRKEQERVRKERAAEVEKAEAEVAEIEKKRQVSADKRKIPDEVSLKDFLFGGQFKKDLKTSRKDLKKTRKELKRQTSELSRLDKQIEELSGKTQTTRNKRKLEQLQSQRSELQSSMTENRKQQLQAIQDYSAAMYRYERTTLVGKIRKRVRGGNKTAKMFIEKYSNTLLSKLPKIKLKKDKKG